MVNFNFDSIQHRFTTGELIEEGQGREDIEQYSGGLAVAKNVQTLGIGAIQRRGGLRRISLDFSNRLNNARLINFRFNAEQDYVISFFEQASAAYAFGVYRDGELLSINSGNLLQGWDLVTMGFAQEADTLILLHKDRQPLRLVRNSDNDWDLSLLEFQNIPRFAFGGETQTDATGTLNGLRNGDTGQKSITITGTTPILDFTPADLIGQFIEITRNGIGRMRIISVEGTPTNRILEVEILTDISFSDASTSDDSFTLGAGQWQFQTGYEPIWSSTRGYPHRAGFHQGRLWIDGGRSLPSFLYGSKANDFFNFDFGRGLDDEAIGALRTDFNEIENIYSARALIVFANHAEYILPVATGEAITPSNASITKQTERGSFNNLIPYESDGGMLFVDRNGRSVRYFIYDETEEAFGASDTSLLSSHLIEQPRSFAVRQQLSADEPTYISLVRQDGNATLGTFLPEQSIASYTQIDTDFTLLDTASDINSLYFVGLLNNRYYLLRLDNDALLDGSVEVAVSNNNLPSTVNHNLQGQMIRVIGKATDGKLYITEPIEATSNSQTINAEWFEGAEIASIEVGLDFEVELVDLPVAHVPDRNLNNVVGRIKDINNIVLNVSNTHYVEVDKPLKQDTGRDNKGSISGSALVPIVDSFTDSAGEVQGTITESYTGMTRQMPMFSSGLDYTAQIRIKSSLPTPLTIRQIRKNINVRDA